MYEGAVSQWLYLMGQIVVTLTLVGVCLSRICNSTHKGGKNANMMQITPPMKKNPGKMCTSADVERIHVDIHHLAIKGHILLLPHTGNCYYSQ